MKNSTIKKSLGLMIGLSSLLPAAEITWIGENITDDTNVSTNGIPLFGVRGSNTTGGTTTVNGVDFMITTLADLAATTLAQSPGSESMTATLGNDNLASFQAGGVGGDLAGLINGGYWGTTGGDTATVTLSGLTVGVTYEIQLFTNDARTSRSITYTMDVSDGIGGAGVTLQLNNSPDGTNTPGQEPGDYGIGTFTADSDTQTFDLTGMLNGTPNAGRTQINGFQLRLLPPDLDEDGIPNDYENLVGLNPNDPSDAALDPDNDDLTNLQEFQIGTLINDDDSDNDNLLDGDEVNIHLTNPLLADTDEDTLNDDVEILTHFTNPLLADSDTDGLSDADEINIHSTNPNETDSDFDGINDPTEILISSTDPNLDTSVPTLDPNSTDLLAYWDFNDDSNAAETTCHPSSLWPTQSERIDVSG